MPVRVPSRLPLALLGAALLATTPSLPATADPPAGRRLAEAPPRPVEPGGRLLVTSPEQAVGLALARAPILRSAEAGRQAARGDRLTAGLRPNPEFSFNAENIGGSGSYGGARSLEATYGLSQRIETGGKRQPRIAASEQALALTGLDVEAARLDLKREVTRALAEAVASGRAVEIARERLRLAEEVLRATRARVEAGREPPPPQRRAEVAREIAAVFLDRAQRESAVALHGLAVLLAVPEVAIMPARAAWFDELGPRPDPARAAALPPEQLDRARLDALIG